MSPLVQAMHGALVMGTLVVGLFFLRYWRATGDRLFVMFALAFWALGVNWLGLALLATTHEARMAFYLLRLLAFVLILAAIDDKDRSARTVGRRPRAVRRRRPAPRARTPRPPAAASGEPP
jgi:hypothetical protein